MSPTKKQVQLAQTIDRWVKTIEQNGGGDHELLSRGFEQTATFKALMDMSSQDQLNALCEAYPGFYRFAKLIESIAQGLHDGTISVPIVH